MPTSLLLAHVTPAEVEKLVDTLDKIGGGVINQPVNKDGKWFSLRSSLRVDLREAKAEYELGSLKVGPIDAVYHVDEFRVKIDWHQVLNIGHEVCLELKDPCGDVIFRE